MMSRFQPPRNEHEYGLLLQWLDEQFDRQIPPETPTGLVVQAVLVLVKNYEDVHYPIPTA